MSWSCASGSSRALSLVLLASLSLIVGCANRSSPAPGGGADPGPTDNPQLCSTNPDSAQCQKAGSDNPDDPGGSGGDSINLCDALGGDSELNGVGSLVQTLCASGRLGQLRNENVVYSGGSDTKFIEDTSELSGEKTLMKLEASMHVDSTAKEYFDMTRLQFTKPGVYKDDAGFETDSDVTYKIQDSSQSSVRYLYENGGHTDQVKYEAVTKFITLKEGVLYATATELDDGDTEPLVVLKLKGLVVIHQNGDQTEVFSLSDQTYDNSGDHDSTFRRAKKSVREEQERNFRNAKNAGKASEYL